MTCRNVDQLLCEYLDGELQLEQRRAFEEHVGRCRNCSEILADSKFAVGILHQTPAIDAPMELIADIIHDTIGVRGTLPMLAPVGGPIEPGLFGWLRPLFNPLLQPRFAMSMVMAVLSLSMLSFYAKGALESFHPGQSKPIAVAEHVSSQFKRAWDATAEFFETVQGMYRLQQEFGTEREKPVLQAAPQNQPRTSNTAGENAQTAPSTEQQNSKPPQQESGR